MPPVRASLLLLLAACGDNLPGPGPDIVPAHTMFLIAHYDDDMIFMQPELLDALHAGSMMTVYVTSGDQVYGDAHSDELFHAARIAYSSVTGAADWDCGYIQLANAPAHHCRSESTGVSVIALDLPEGGREGQFHDSLLHHVEGDVRELPILGPIGGHTNVDAIADELSQLVAATAPAEIHALDVAATHGRDHMSHLFASSFGLWGAARAGYAGAWRWHRGYNVSDDPPTLPDDEFAPAAVLLGYYEACYFHCGACGTSCKTLDASHDTWLHRQYSADRVTAGSGALATADGSACFAATAGGSLVLGDCARGDVLRLDPAGHLVARELCAQSAHDATVTHVPCTDTAAQYWVLDSEGHLWNGEPPEPGPAMDYDHVRCLATDDAGVAVAPTCGADLEPAWQFDSSAAS